MTKSNGTIEKISWIAGLTALGWFIYRAINLAWIGDDAFISFRYAKNLIDGHGLVYNIGERVEGYTNFLWTVLISLGMKLGFEPISFTWFFSILSSITTIGLFLFLSWRIFKKDNSTTTLFLPVTAIALAVQYDFQVWSTSGLETAMATMFVTVGFVILSLGSSMRSNLFAGMIFSLAALTRPDMLIFAVTALAFVLIVERGDWKKSLYFIAPLILIYLPYWLIRSDFYGNPFPNTFYAKSAELYYFSQGLTYLWLYLKSYLVFFFVLPALVLAVIAIRSKKISRPIPLIRATGLSLLFIPTFLLYVAKTGGDFMFARFLVPVTPFLFFIIESALSSWIPTSWRRIAVGSLIVTMVFFRYDLFPKGNSIEGIVDERFYYPSEQIESKRIKGEKLRDFLAGSGTKVAYFGGQAMNVYYSEVPLAIEADAGLTDEYVAHLPLEKRGRIGHEKKAPMEYLYQRRVNFFFKTNFSYDQKFDKYRNISFGEYDSFIFIYETQVMNYLKRFDKVKFVDFQLFLDNYIDQLDRMEKNDIIEDYQFFLFYYFSVNNDPIREEKIKAALL